MKKVLVWLIASVCAVVKGAVLFLKLYPGFGGRPDNADKEEYAKRAVNFSGEGFVYPAEYKLGGLTENVLISGKGRRPEAELPTAEPAIPDEPEADKVYITWFGHSTVLVQMHGLNLLFDPVYSRYSSPVQFAGPERFSHPPVSLEELPEIDAVIITHDHYDHLDMNTVKQLNGMGVRFIAPLGVDAHLERWGVPEENITAMTWWEETEISGLTVACTPTKHYSGRLRLGSNETLFASWVLKDDIRQIFICGDSGFGSHFEAIHEHYGDFDLVLMDGAQYNMAWHDSHMFPEESVMACGMLGAGLAMPVHWGAFSLAPHAWDDPVTRFTAAAEKEGLETITPMIGATVDLDDIAPHQQHWWEDIK